MPAKEPDPGNAMPKSTTTLTVADIMSKNPVRVDMTASIHELAEILDGNGISGAPVVDPGGTLVGVVSQKDLIHRIIEGPLDAPGDGFFGSLAEVFTGGVDAVDLGCVEDVMSLDPVTATPDEPVAAIARRMAEHRVHRVIVINDGREPIGIVTTLDVLRVFPA